MKCKLEFIVYSIAQNKLSYIIINIIDESEGNKYDI